MKLHAVAAFAALLLAACDNPKPRQIPPDPMAAPPGPVAAVPPPKDGMSAGLAKRPEFAAFYLDAIGSAHDPVNKQPAATKSDVPVTVSGFGFDPVAKVPAKGVDVVLDGTAYGTTYGGSRPDVAAYFKAPALAATGYTMTLPAGRLAKGQHMLVIRVIAADAKGYFESPPVTFTAN